MSNEAFKSVFWGVNPQAVHNDINQLTSMHTEKINALQVQLTELSQEHEALKEEVDALEKLLALPELAPRFLEIAETKLDRTEAYLKNAALMDQQGIHQEFHNRNIANELKKQQIEENIRLCREQFQSMMSNLNAMIQAPLKKAAIIRRPNLVIVEPTPKEKVFTEEPYTAKLDKSAATEPLDAEVLRYQYLFGKLAGQDILLPDGQYLIKKDQKINIDIVKAAQQHGKLPELVKGLSNKDYQALS